jgi:hypothetical protein
MGLTPPLITICDFEENGISELLAKGKTQDGKIFFHT